MTNDPSLVILVADDEAIVRSTVGDYLKDAGHEVVEASDGERALAAIDAQDIDLALVDVRMPGIDGLTLLERVRAQAPEVAVVIVTAHGNMDMVIRALRAGAVDFLNKPVRFRELDAVLEKARQVRGLRQDKRRLKDTIAGIQATGARAGGEGMIGSSQALARVRLLIRQAAEARVETILITGETGTGKEVVARQIHQQAAAPADPFLAVNCAAIPEALLESELFGHRKGAFTGANEHRAGYFELADGGTLFLDEIGDLTAQAQAKLLRVLETRHVRRIGEGREKEVKVRVVAATNADLTTRVADNRFRADLLYRLNVFEIHVPPLRERPSDVLPLAEHFLRAFCEARGWPVPAFDAEARERLLGYEYPGNVRELRNLVERAAILGRGGSIGAAHLTLPAARGAKGHELEPGPDEGMRARILAALEETRWNRREAAKALDMPYSTLRFRMQRLGIG